MDYSKSGVFSGKEKIDARNLVLCMNFRNEGLEAIAELAKLIDEFFIEKFAEDFVFDIYFDGEDVLLKPLRKKLQNMISHIGRSVDLTYDAVLKSEKISTRADYRRLIDEGIIIDDEIEFSIEDIPSLKHYIIDNINRREVNYEMAPMPQDIGLSLNCEYLPKNDEEENFGYFGNLRFNISGYILNHDYEYFTAYLKEFLRSSSKILKSQCANIFVSDRKFSTDYFSTFATMTVELDDRCLLEGVEGINFVNEQLFEALDEALIEEYSLEVEKCANGYFVNLNKPLTDVDIDDKYKLRAVLDEVLVKGSSHLDLVQFDDLLGRVPIYLEEITIAENCEEENTEMVFAEGLELEQQKEENNMLSRVFIIASNSEVESYDVNSLKLHRFSEEQ